MPSGESHFRSGPERSEPDVIRECVLLLSIDPNNVPLRLTLCRLLAARGQHVLAIQWCEDGLAALKLNGPLALTRRLRLVAMQARLKRAVEKRR